MTLAEAISRAHCAVAQEGQIPSAEMLLNAVGRSFGGSETDSEPWETTCAAVAEASGLWFAITPGEKDAVSFMHPGLGCVFKSRQFHSMVTARGTRRIVARDIFVQALNFLRNVDAFAQANNRRLV